MLHAPGATARRPPRRLLLVFAVAAVAGANALVGGVDAAQPAKSSAAAVRTAHNAKLSATILVNSRGRTLYHLTRETSHHIVCTGGCAALWPPLTVHSKRAASGRTVKGLSTVRRPDGTLQLAYRGMPLYTFRNDHKAGDANGQGFLGVWFALPVGAVAAPAPAPVPPSPSPYGY